MSHPENGGASNGHAAEEHQDVMMEVEPKQRRAPRLNERILSSLSRRSVAAHPWHDLEIGTLRRLLSPAGQNASVRSSDMSHLFVRAFKICRS